MVGGCVTECASSSKAASAGFVAASGGTGTPPYECIENSSAHVTWSCCINCSSLHHVIWPMPSHRLYLY